jgi:hypothetical protein
VIREHAKQAATIATLVVVVAAPVAAPAAAPPVRNDRVSPDDAFESYRRLDGAVDTIHERCGGDRRQQAEPAVAVNPRDPRIIVAGAMDACLARRNPLPVPQAQHWSGLYRSTDGGRSWRASLLPGYPGDTSQEGIAAQISECQQQGDATMAFDNEGRLFYGTLCPLFPSEEPVPLDFHIAVATFDQDGSRYAGMATVGNPDGARGSANGPATSADKPNLAVDQTRGPHAGNVYMAWTECPRVVPERNIRSVAPCVGREGVMQLSRSIDHGRSFSDPITVGPPGPPLPKFADLAVGPDGAVYLTWRTSRLAPDEEGAIYLAKSTDGGESFTTRLVTRFRAMRSRPFAGGGDSDQGIQGEGCGDGPFACPSGLTFAPFESTTAVAADERGVHLVWGGLLPDGQAKVFALNSPDGTSWPKRAVTIDSVPRGHQFSPDVASADGVISIVFLDSRADPAYATDLPPGTTRDGKNPGPGVDTYVAQSRDGGKTWTERRLSTASSQPNYETYLDNRLPWRGDYMYVSAVPGGAYGVWTDSRDVVPGTDTRPDSEQNGFDVLAPCTWSPNSVNGPPTGYATPAYDDSCLSQGGLDLNIYGAPLVNSSEDGCLRPSKVGFKLHRVAGTRVVRVEAFVNGKRRLVRRGRDVSRITLADLPRAGRLSVRIVATHSTGSKVVSKRMWNGCRKGKPSVRVIRRHGAPRSARQRTQLTSRQR